MLLDLGGVDIRISWEQSPWTQKCPWRYVWVRQRRFLFVSKQNSWVRRWGHYCELLFRRKRHRRSSMSSCYGWRLPKYQTLLLLQTSGLEMRFSRNINLFKNARRFKLQWEHSFTSTSPLSLYLYKRRRLGRAASPPRSIVRTSKLPSLAFGSMLIKKLANLPR